MSEITERLRNRIHDSHMEAERLMDDALMVIEAQEARIAELEKALGDIAEDLDYALTVLECGDITRLRDRLSALSKPQTQ